MTIGGGVALLLGVIIGKALKTVADALKPLPFPGPKGVPVFGVAFVLDPNTALMRLCDWAKQFGGTYAFRVFSTTYVVIKDSKTIKQILKDSNKGVFMRQMNTLSLLPKSGIFLTDGDAWKYNRRTVDPIIAEPNVRGMVPIMGQMSRRLANVVSALADPSGNIHNWEPHKLLQLAALDFTVATHFGKDYNLLSPLDTNGSAERENVHKTFQNFLEGFDFILKHIQLGPFIQNRYPFKLNKDVAKFYSAVDNVEKYSKEIIARRQEELKKGAAPECNILDKLIFMGKQDLIWNLVT
ncbi:hypothetical protein FOZ62_026779, partial [Perkinsus olseni]